MKRFLFAVFAAAVALSAFTGCTRTILAPYTNDGRTIVSDGKPKESDPGLLGYTDANGVKQQINKTDVKEAFRNSALDIFRKRPNVAFSLPGYSAKIPANCITKAKAFRVV